MDSGISTIRNLIYIVLVLTLLSILPMFTSPHNCPGIATRLDRLGLLLQKQMMGTLWHNRRS